MRQVFRSLPWVQQREPERFIDFFRRQGVRVTLPKGGAFLNHGTEEGQTALLVEGLVSFDFLDNATKQRTFALILPWRTIGDLDALNPRRANVLVEVLQDSTFLVVQNRDFRHFLRESVENMELYADLSILKAETIMEGAFANFSMTLEERLRVLFLAIVQAESVMPDADGWYKLPVRLSVTDVTRIVSASRAWVSATYSEWIRAGLLRREGRTVYVREAVFAALRDWIKTSDNVAPTSILVKD